jgi:hypothetical protein
MKTATKIRALRLPCSAPEGGRTDRRQHQDGVFKYPGGPILTFAWSFQQALWRMLESKDHQQIQAASGVLDLKFA